MKRSKLVASFAVLAILPAAAHAQQVTLVQGPGICAGSPPNSYNWWVGMASGPGCEGNGGGGGASNVLEWAYLDGATEFNGMYFTGYGSFSIEMLSGEDVLYLATFESWGENTLITVPEFAGSVTGIRIRRQSGIGAFGVGEDGFIPPVQGNGGPGPQGNGPGGGGPPGNGPAGNGPPGNGPDGNGPPGDGPGGNNGGLGPNGGGDDENDDPPFGGDDDVNLLVNETNAAPEPATILLVASGLGGVGAMARRRRKQNKDS